MSSNKIILVAAIIGIFACCVSCRLTFPIKGNGNLVTYEKTVSAFDKIRVSNSAVVRFHASSEYRAVVTIDENLDEYVEVVTRNNVLNIGTESGSYLFTKFSVDIYCPVLTGVSIFGSGNFENMDKITASTFEMSVSGSGGIKVTVDCENFSAKISGSGGMVAAGSCKDADIGISGSGRFNGDEFIINNATVSISGSGSMNVYVADNLKANISGSGNISYRGEPKIDSRVNGSGRIRKL